jgi:DNA-binding transcriptional MocR family regulator
MLFGSSVDFDGHPAFRAALARHALRARINVAPEDIVVTHGAPKP